jgi:hypothetical protein
MYRVLYPVYRKTGERISVTNGTRTSELDVFAVTWRQTGLAGSMEEAKRRFGGYPVLEPI